jgi:glycosyltransferase involved in cell wall biosynthesis
VISDSSSEPKIQIVVRSFNEEKWIRSCLTTIFAQDYSNFFVTVVDSGSVDATTRIVREFKDVNLINTEDYRPGRAIMDGVRSDSMGCDYLFLVSAHCLLIGHHVLNDYVTTMQSRDDLAGIYGRQLPLHFTSPYITTDKCNAILLILTTL